MPLIYKKAGIKTLQLDTIVAVQKLQVNFSWQCSMHFLIPVRLSIAEYGLHKKRNILCDDFLTVRDNEK
jgi:hypothetical protein